MSRIEELKGKISGGVIIDGKRHVIGFEKWDKTLIADVEKVFAKHGVLGRIAQLQITVDCGMPPQKSPRLPRHCFRVCHPGPRDEPICTWICV
jgi:hypothetical protein